jgi:hypothetical protein
MPVCKEGFESATTAMEISFFFHARKTILSSSSGACDADERRAGDSSHCTVGWILESPTRGHVLMPYQTAIGICLASIIPSRQASR